jgi:hypothetical protein
MGGDNYRANLNHGTAIRRQPNAQVTLFENSRRLNGMYPVSTRTINKGAIVFSEQLFSQEVRQRDLQGPRCTRKRVVEMKKLLEFAA